MTATMPRVQEARKRGEAYRPHVGGTAVELAAMLRELGGSWSACGAKRAERAMAIADAVNRRIVEAARRAGRIGWARFWAAPLVSALSIDGAPMQCDTAFACAIHRDALAEAGSLTAWIAAQDAASRAALLRTALKLRTENNELIAALTHAEPCR